MEVIPKHFFAPRMIQQRPPLSSSARRAGWVGCNILLDQIMPTGRLQVIGLTGVVPKSEVRRQWNATLFLRSANPSTSRGWLLDVMQIVDGFRSDCFTLSEVYKHTATLSEKYPANRHARPKVRQQLQLLRDHGYIRFLGAGNYEKLWVVSK